VGGDGEVAGDLVRVVADEEVAAGPLAGGVAGVAPEPVVEGGVPAVEAFEVVTVPEGFDPKGHRIRER
jgi:hypothetical protein